VKTFEFTNNLTQMQKNVDTLKAGGGADAPEAMSCGLAAAAALSWNRDAMQLLIHIGDEKPHGICCGGGDNYPDGCPDGHDALRVAHNLAKKGIPIYNVYCGRGGDSLTETFYHALSHITNGQCLQLQDATTLSEIVLGAAMEEQTMNKISQKIMPIWDHVHERHPHARDDQIIYELYQRLKADRFEVKCVLGGRELCKSAMKSIETIAFCTDIKQVKAMQEQGGEHFYSWTKGSGAFTKETTKLIDEGQVRKWYKRNKKIMAIAEFKKKGCQYAQPRWQKAAAEERVGSGELARFGNSKRQPLPWEKVDMKRMRTIFNDAGKISKDLKRGTPLAKAAGVTLARTAPKAETTGAAGPPRPLVNRFPAPSTAESRNVTTSERRTQAWNPAPSRRMVQPQNATPPRAVVQPQNVTPPRAVVQPQNVTPPRAVVQPRNVTPPRSVVQPRNVTPPRPVVQPQNVAAPRWAVVQPPPVAASTSWTGAPGPLPSTTDPIVRNTSYPVNDTSRSGSRTSPLRSSRGAPLQSIRTSRSTSREPQRSTGWSRPPVSASNPPGPRTTMSRPPAAAAPSSRSSSGSFAPTENHARSVVVKFDQQQIITDYLYSRFQMAGANPSNVQIVDGLAYVSFPTQQSADLASRNRIYYRNGVPMETQTLEKFRQTNV